LAALRRIQTRVVRGDVGALKATLPSDVALYLLNQKREELMGLESRYGAKVALVPRPDFAKERCDIETTAREGPPPWMLPHQPGRGKAGGAGAAQGGAPGQRGDRGRERDRETDRDRDRGREREGRERSRPLGAARAFGADREGAARAFGADPEGAAHAFGAV